MCNTTNLSNMHIHRNYSPIVDPFSFSTFHLLRTCNQLILPNSTDVPTYYNALKENQVAEIPVTSTVNLELSKSQINNENKSPIVDVIESSIPSNPSIDDVELNVNKIDKSLYDINDSEDRILLSSGNMNIPLRKKLTSLSTLPGFEYIVPQNQPQHHHLQQHTGHTNFTHTNDIPQFIDLNRFGNVLPSFLHRRQRGEKRPIPDEQKDEKYYERRKRNNEAAKKSRDARKIREDRVAFRAAVLEQENSILRAQIITLREELQTLRHLMNTSATPLLNGRSVIN